MANLKEKAAWESGIYQLETTDPVVGGADGISNKQAIQLANRTSYLKEKVDALTPAKIFEEIKKIDGTDSGLDADKLDGLNSSSFVQKGEFGIGANNAPVISNLDDITTLAGFWKTNEQSTGTFPAAWNGRAKHANVIVERLDPNWIKQTITEISSVDTPSIYYRTNKNASRTWGEWKEVVAGKASAVSSSNSIVARDANGDFEGRWVTASHFLMKTAAQDNIFDANSEICFRNKQAAGMTQHMRFVSLESLTGFLGATDTVAGALVRRNADGDFAGRYISAAHFRLMAQQQNNLFHNGCDLLFRTSSADDQNYVRGVNANYAATMMGVIGIGQSWQNVTAQRAANVTYTNTTGRPIQVFIQSQNLHQSGSFVINGISFQFAFATNYYQAGQNVSFIVPAGNTYFVDLPFSMWLELR
ncbi:pyocin knob domain-containing protein [Campylobacter concisus]|uniref:pyocin knob domain-containing protein n=1 Tax=Campylobacter concisus TaxID=199 RepID=UPI001C5A662C|nr:pyocin knob domain-containing protein [Campylobacter concisus]